MIESEISEPVAMPPTDAQKMEYIRFAVPAELLKQAEEMAEAEGWKPAEFYRVVWAMGLNLYAEGSNKRLVNRKLRKEISEGRDRKQ